MATKQQRSLITKTGESRPTMVVKKLPKGWVARIEYFGAVQHRMYGGVSPSIAELQVFLSNALGQELRVKGLRRAAEGTEVICH
jgi:hypothetical protein